MGVLGQRSGEKAGKEGAEGSGWARLGGMRQILSSPLGEGTIRNRRREDPAVFVHYLSLPLGLPDPYPCVFLSPRNISPECKLSRIRPRGWLPIPPSPPVAGQGLSPDRRRGVLETSTLWKGAHGGRRGSGSRGGAGGPGQRAAHLQDTVISTLVAGMLPAKESNSLSDAMSSGCSIAHRAPHPKSVNPCAMHASSGATETQGSSPQLRSRGWAAKGGEESEEGAWEVREGRGRRERGPRREEGCG